MASKTFNIDSFPQGYYMSWFVTTQAAYNVEAKLYDSNKTYFQNSKQNTNINPPLAQGAENIEGTSLKLDITETSSNQLNSSINTYNITNEDGTIVGYGYNITIEDATDNDYNDVCVVLVAWKSRG